MKLTHEQKKGIINIVIESLFWVAILVVGTFTFLLAMQEIGRWIK